MKKLLFIFLLSVFVPINLSAQENRMNLKDCMQYAVEHSTEIGIQLAANDNNKINHREACLKWIPSLSGDTYGYAQFGRSIDPETNTYTTTSSFHNGYNLSASYPVFDGFSVVNNYKVSKIALLSGIDQLQQIEDDLCLRVLQAYCNVLYREGMVKLTSERLYAGRQLLEQTKLMEEIGLKGPADVLQVEAEVAECDYKHVKEINELTSAKLTLAELMFYSSEQSLNIDTSVLEHIDPFFSFEQAQSIFAEADQYLPSLKIVKSDVEKAKYNYRTARYQVLPSLYLNAGYSTSFISTLDTKNKPDSYMNQLRNKGGEYVQLTLSTPIFNQLKEQGKKTRAKNAWKTAQLQKDQKYKEVEIEIQRAVQNRTGAAKEYIQSSKKVDAYNKAYQANVRKYQEGMISVLDLQTSSNQLLHSKVEKLNATLTYMITTKIVNYYKGIPYLDQD